MILNLKNLNQFVDHFHFKMETLTYALTLPLKTVSFVPLTCMMLISLFIWPHQPKTS